MKVYRNYFFPTVLQLLALASKCKISICETPVPNNFGVIPEYGKVLSPGHSPSFHNSSTANSHHNLGNYNSQSSSSSLETLSSTFEPQYDDGENYYSPENDYFHHYDYDESYQDNENENSEELSNNLASEKDKNKGRGFEDPSSSSIMKFLMSPLQIKPFSLLPSVFRKIRKKKRGGRRHRGRRHRRPLTKGRRESPEYESSSELRGIRDEDDEYDLHMDSSESSAGYRRRKRGRGRGRGWSSSGGGRGKGRGRKRRRKPKRGWRSRLRHRPRPRPHHNDDDYDDGDDNVVPIKVTYDESVLKLPHQNKMMGNNELSFDNQHYNNNEPDLHKPAKEEETGTLASFFKNSFKSGFGMIQGTNKERDDQGGIFPKKNNGMPPSFMNFGRGQRLTFPRSIYDKLPPVPGMAIMATTQRPYIAPLNHPMRIMRPPIPPRLPPFFSYPAPSTTPTSYQYVSVDGETTNGQDGGDAIENVVKNDELGTPSASFNFPEFPPPRGRLLRPWPTPHFRPSYDETVPQPYLSAPSPFPVQFTIAPKHPPGVARYSNGFATRVRFPVEMRTPRQYPRHQRLLIPLHQQRGYGRAESNILSFNPPPASFPSLHNSVLSQPHYGFPSPSPVLNPHEDEPEGAESTNDSQQMDTESVEMNNPSISSSSHEQFQKVTPTPQIIYGQWNPLVDRVDETSANL